GFTCGVEWLATEKILVHDRAGLAWGGQENTVPELARLNRLLSEHPCFFDGVKLTRLSPAESPVFALQRVSADGEDVVLVLVNTDAEKPNTLEVSLADGAAPMQPELQSPREDLLGQPAPRGKQTSDGKTVFTLGPGACYCLGATATARGISGEEYRRARARAAWAINALSRVLDPEEIGPHDWCALAEHAARSPKSFLGSLAHLDKKLAREDLLAALNACAEEKKYPQVIAWGLIDRRRITTVPPRHWLLIEDDAPFRAALRFAGGPQAWHVQSVAV